MTNESAATAPPGRRTLIRDTIAFQLKLLADGLRDVILAPASLAAALISFIGGGTAFYDLVRYARRSDRWINLFAAADRLPTRDGSDAADGDLDSIVDRVELFLVNELQRGGIDKDAKDRIAARLRALVGGAGKDPDPR